MRYSRPFRDVIPHSKAGHPRVTHPFATLLAAEATFAFDLHVLGMPPALILSQDQTLMLKVDASRPPDRRPLERAAPERPSAICLQRKNFWLFAALFSLSSCPRLHPGPRDPRHPRADTRRVVLRLRPPPRLRASAWQVETCVCLHALSSFQRTDRRSPRIVFKGTF